MIKMQIGDSFSSNPRLIVDLKIYPISILELIYTRVWNGDKIYNDLTNFLYPLQTNWTNEQLFADLEKSTPNCVYPNTAGPWVFWVAIWWNSSVIWTDFITIFLSLPNLTYNDRRHFGVKVVPTMLLCTSTPRDQWCWITTRVLLVMCLILCLTWMSRLRSIQMRPTLLSTISWT